MEPVQAGHELLICREGCVRLFVAIELPQEVRAHLSRVQERLRPLAPKAGWTNSNNLHVTLKFLGEVGDADVARLCETLSSVPAGQPVDLHADRVDCLPPCGPVRIIGAGIGGDVEPLKSLQAQIESACETLGFARERRIYRPHITIGRARAPLATALRERFQQASADLWPGPSFTMLSFALMQSQLQRGGSVYTRVAAFSVA
jgi:RNA 2',3'-cyclic 3'-phosphodiesterase